MTAIEFPEQTLVIAKDQPEYMPLPAHVAANGVVTFCWKLTPDEIAKLIVTGMLWHQVHTYGSSLQPQQLCVTKPDLEKS